MELSNRITHLTPGGSDGWEVFYKARALKTAGEPVTELTIGEHDIRTHPSILDAMHVSAKGGHTGYAAVPGTQALREAVATRIQTRTGVATGAENILITPGGQAALYAAFNAICDEGDTALFIDPYYATYPGTIRGIGGVPQAIPAYPRNGFQPRAEDIEEHAKGATSLLINTPNNPTGAVYTRDTLQAIADTCIANDLWLISDEVYDTQVWDGSHLSPRALPNMADRTLVVGSMSKSHAMTGSRVGWVCGPADAIEHLINLATHTTYGVPGYIQDAALFALGEGTPLEDVVSAPFSRRRKITEDLLAKQNIVKGCPISGAMYAMLDVRATGLSGQDFANALLDEHLIATMPGESFGTAAAGHVRVAMTIDDETYTSALQTLLDFAKDKAS
ncbi:arginine:pyruvate transaminase [Octadecabacter temperatus]|uniref:Aminotransferase n=1 Tax=Octadecabacter temperatus TaxID=1458307 RepID=A0A0K0Y5B5_9RHOB|nr:aminotransferase class I/II-fold pyridoxal phosphate-dependent enzyme [Octadecabacter temperatus]AKS46178.1 Arginine--pyruvate transaminase AruH [Octadecabacter temperatus]SIO09072.1 arginine:pyruvate transaminase [Octadecabacter temperatus]